MAIQWKTKQISRKPAVVTTDTAGGGEDDDWVGWLSA